MLSTMLTLSPPRPPALTPGQRAPVAMRSHCDRLLPARPEADCAVSRSPWWQCSTFGSAGFPAGRLALALSGFFFGEVAPPSTGSVTLAYSQ